MSNQVSQLIRAAVVLMAAIAAVSRSQAGVVASYTAGAAGNPNGAPDPRGLAGGSWNLYDSTLGGPNFSQGGVSPDGAYPYNAWQIFDNTNGASQYLYYYQNLTATQESAAVGNGAVLSCRLRVLDPVAGNNGIQTINFSVGMINGHRFICWLNVNPNGDLTANLQGVGGASLTLTTGGIGALDYHLHQIVYDAEAQSASYVFDGVTNKTGWTGLTTPVVDQVQWGASSSSGMGAGWFNSVTFETNAIVLYTPPPPAPPPTFYVATNGSDANAGTIDAPLATLTAAQTKLRAAGVTANGGQVWIRGGRYPLTSTCFLTAADSGATNSPAIWSAAPGEQVIFDGGTAINPLAFAVETNATDVARLNSVATNKVYSQPIANGTLIGLLSDRNCALSFNGRLLHVARYPNQGFGVIDSINTATETIATLGTPTAPVGAKVHLAGNYNTNAWAAELARTQVARLRGYVSADWLKESLRLYSVDAAGTIWLMDGAHYVFGSASSVERAFVDQLLCELDEPGEWYFDSTNNKLYLWPPDALAASTTISVLAGPKLAAINGASNVQLKRLTIQNLNGSGLDITSGNNNLVAGCTFRNIRGYAINISGGTNNGALSCDFIDVESGGGLAGGSFSPTSVTDAGNFIENCHFRQIYSRDFYGKVMSISGAGNKFRHNLAHNSNGQIMTMAGSTTTSVDNLYEFNEIFNTGVEEGDGGTIYQDASITAFGNTYRNNLWHHTICIPSLISRASIYGDDGTCGYEINGNVFYKAGEAIKSNNGGGHIGLGNIFVSNYYGIDAIDNINGTVTPAMKYANNMNYLNTSILDGNKLNLIGHGLAVFGSTGWDTSAVSNNWLSYVSPFWTARYPRLGALLTNWWTTKAMNNDNRYTNSVFYGNSVTTHGSAVYLTMVGSTNIPDLSAFVDPAVLNFKYKTPLPPYAANIPFEQVGLYLDEYRTTLPDKDTYRGIIAEHWKNTASSGSGISYSPANVNARCYFNTGLLLQGLTTQVNGAQALGNDVTPQVVGALPSGVMADSILDWKGASSHVQPDGAWEYGYYASVATNFTQFSLKALNTDSAVSWIGGGGLTWQTSGNSYPQAGQYSLIPGNTQQVVKRWNSTCAGSALVLVDAQQLQTSGNGQTVRVYLNGAIIATLPLTASANHQAASIAVTLAMGDKLDLAVDSLGSNGGDWTLASMRVDTQTPADASRVAWLPMDESGVYPSGTNGTQFDSRLVVADFGNGNHHGVITNMSGKIAWVPGVRGNALQFEGVNEYAPLLGSAVASNATALTISLWINPQAKTAPNEAMISSMGTDFFGLNLSSSGNGMPVEFRAKNQRVTGPDYSGLAGQWTHVTGVWQSGGSQTLYINGVNVGSSNAVSGATSVTNWLLGSDRLMSGRYYSGAMDELQIYTNALSSTQVMALYTNALNSYAGFQSPADQNNDGIPDWWQIKYYGFAGATNAAPNAIGANGLSNLQDYLSGLTPTNPASILQLTVGSVTPASGGTVTLQWPGAMGHTYSVQWKPTLTANWTTLPGIIPGQSSATSATITGNTNTTGFYRIFVNSN